VLRHPALRVAGCVLLLAAAALSFDVSAPLVLAGAGGICVGLALSRWWPRWHAPASHTPRQSNGDSQPADAKFLESVNLAAQAAGVRILDWDLLSNQLTVDRKRMQVYSEQAQAVATDPNEFTTRIVHTDDLQHFRREVGKALKYKNEVMFSYRALLPDGTARPVQLHGQVFRNAAGRPTRMLGVTVDVSVQLAASEKIEQQAREQRLMLERLDMAAEMARVGILDWDLVNGQLTTDGRITRQLAPATLGNDNAMQLLQKIVHPEDWDGFQQTLEVALASSDLLEHSYRCILPDGSIQHTQLRAKIFRDSSGKAVRLLGASSDTTRVVAATAEIERQAQQERLLLDRLSIATQTANICSWEADLEARRFLWVDNPIKTISGVQDISGPMSIWEARVHPEDLKNNNDMVRQAIMTGQERYNWRYRDISSEGRVSYVQVHARLIYRGAKQLPRLLGVSWDVTPAVHAAEILQQQAQQLEDAQRRLERASLSSLEGHWETDLTKHRVWFSTSCHTLLGYPQGLLPTTTQEVAPLFHDEDLPHVRAAFIRHYKDGTPFSVDARMRTSSGEYRWYRQRGTAGRDETGRAISMAGSMQDIHTQKLTEDALKLAQQRFERAINGTQDGLWELQASGGAWCSPRLLELLGYNGEELPSDTHFLNDFLHPDDAATVAAATQAHFEHGAPYDVEIRLRTKSSDYGWYRARARAERDSVGQPVRLSGSLQDVTEARKAREALILATEAANTASRAKSEFLANVSHEIRTPMNGILGMTTLLLDTALDRSQRDYAATIRSSADSLLVVMNDILDFSKMEAGKLEIESIELDPHHEVEEIAAAMAPQAVLKNLELVVDIHPEVPRRVLGDSQRLRQCLLNLVSNALKFTRSGEVVIAVSVVGPSEDSQQLRCEVRDTGIGIATATLATLFQPFVQADSSITRHFGGTGLGLSIVRRLVELMGGAVGVSSELGFGSTFWFTVPLQRPTRLLPVENIGLTRLGRRVLVVDHNAAQCQAIARQLLSGGYDAECAATSTQALDCLQASANAGHGFDVVLARYAAADTDSAALLGNLQVDAQLAHPRVIALITLEQQSDLPQLSSLGCSGYLCKPVRNSELLSCVDRALSGAEPQFGTPSLPPVGVSIETQRCYDAYVLLAEDNVVNQKVAVRFLERLGCRVRVAANGAQARDAHREERFDLILMDLQMPEMDGITATRAIRSNEGEGHRTPIVALTANAMPGQEGRCLEAGMDGFMTKPLQLTRLHSTLEQLGLALASARSVALGQPAARVPIDLVRLHELTEGDPEFTRELATTFMLSGQQILAEMQAALASTDRDALNRAAHKLKGASANIHAEPLRELAQELELQMGPIEVEPCRVHLERLTHEFSRAMEFLHAHTPASLANAG
jgi:PAS domain S-box-containing protein